LVTRFNIASGLTYFATVVHWNSIMDEEIKHIIVKIKVEDESRFRKLCEDTVDYQLFGEMLDAYESTHNIHNDNYHKQEFPITIHEIDRETSPIEIPKTRYRTLHGRVPGGVSPRLKGRGKMGFPDF